MNTQQFIGYLHTPGQLGKEAGAQLDSLTREFPYFQAAQLLYVKALHNENSFLYNNQLKLAAAYAADRRVLYELITRKPTAPEPVTIPPAETIEPVKTAEQQQPVAEVKTTEEARLPEHPNQQFKAKLAGQTQEWDESVLRQLQLLRQWQNNPTSGAGFITPVKPVTTPAETQEPVLPAKEEETKTIEVQPAAETPSVIEPADTLSAEQEMKQILTVLIESGEDETEPENELPATETPLEEPGDELDYEITPLEKPEAETEPVIEVPEDTVTQEILFKAIGSSIELEVSDELPSAEEFRISGKAQQQEPTDEEKQQVKDNQVSFAQWLKQLNCQAQETQEQAEEPTEEKQYVRKPQDDIVEKFIQAEPRITPQKAAFYNPVNMARKSVNEDSDMVTETLARIYEKQGNIAKAIRAYQKLSLKYPEKSLYFASLIENLKKTPNKNSK